MSAVAGLLGALACTGVIGEKDPGRAGPGAALGGPSGAGNGNGSGGGLLPDGAVAPGPGVGPGAPGTTVTPGPGAAPLRRLSSREYANTVRDLFPGVTLPAMTFPPPTKVDGFENNELSLPATALLVDAELKVAESVADAAVSTPGGWMSCTTEDAACAHQAVDDLLLRAYRRPPTTTERDRAIAFVDAGLAAGTFADTMKDLVEVVLASPEFLYRLETADTGQTTSTWLNLDDYELASRLSYFLWESMPDQTLLDLAKNGKLQDPDTLTAQAERLIADPRAHDVVADFHRQWLELDRLSKLTLDAAMFPELDDGLRASMQSSMEAFLDYAFWDRRSVSALFSSDQTFADARLASLLGVSGAGTTEAPISAPNRRGLLTQPGWLASTSHGTLHSPVLRGVQILRRFLCVNIPPPPANVVTAVDPIPPGQARTTREHFELTHVKAECATCHDQIDPAGYTLENYDALGRYVTEENGVPVDSTGSLPVGASGATAIHGGLELADVLAASPEVRSCLATNWFRFAFGRSPKAASDRAEVQNLAASITGGEGDPEALLLAIVKSTSFRTRPGGAP